MKRIIIVVLLLSIAAIAGIVRSYSKAGHSISELPRALSGVANSKGEVREEIRQNYELSLGAQVEVSSINGAVKVETADSQTAEVYIERIGKSPQALSRRKITIESSPTLLIIKGQKGDAGFLARLFGSNPTERVTLRLPKQISLLARGVNGSVTVGEIEGPVQVRGVNGKVDVGQASGSADLKGINGNISLALKQLDQDGVRVSGVNGNIELRLHDGLNADLEARGMNGSVRSDLPDVLVEKRGHAHRYSAQIGAGGFPISVSRINGNVRLTRALTASASEQAKS